MKQITLLDMKDNELNISDEVVYVIGSTLYTGELIGLVTGTYLSETLGYQLYVKRSDTETEKTDKVYSKQVLKK